MKVEMNLKIPEYNAQIGSDLDKRANYLKKLGKNYTRSYVLLLLLGAFFAETEFLFGYSNSFSIAVVCTFIGFIFYRKKTSKNLIEQWTYTRVASETIKSEWFKFVVGGGDYPIKDTVEESFYLDLLKSKINEFIEEYKKNIHSVGGDYVLPNDLNLDNNSLELRRSSLEERLNFYKEHRMVDQKTWYESKSKFMKKRYRRFNFIYQWSVGLGSIIGIAMIANDSLDLGISFLRSIDVFSIGIAFAFALDGYSNINQYERLSIQYKKSFHELIESIEEMVDPKNEISTNEAVFSEFVEDIENKISVEHKSWSLTTSSKNIHGV